MNKKSNPLGFYSLLLHSGIGFALQLEFFEHPERLVGDVDEVRQDFLHH